MARAAERQGPSDDEKAEKYQEFLQEEIGKPMRYVFHDVDASDDEKLEQLRDEHGFEAMGRWWLLVERMAGRKWHRFETRRAHGWERLARALEFDGDDAVERCKEFIGWLLELELLHRDSFEECGYVRSERIERNAYQMAEGTAGRMLGAWIKQQKSS